MIFNLIIDWIWIVLAVIVWILFYKIKKTRNKMEILREHLDKLLTDISIRNAINAMQNENIMKEKDEKRTNS